MILVVDANILFSALIRNGITRKILVLSGYDFYAPEFTIQELTKHLAELQKKTGLDKEKLAERIDELLAASNLVLVPFEEFEEQKDLSGKISPDPGDVAYLALALHLNCSLWSNDAVLKKQKRVKVINTKELIGYILRG